MVIGKTSSSISKTEIFTKFSEAQVLSKVFPEIKSVPCVISSPFRRDSHPSFSIYMGDNNHIYYKDFGDVNEKGSLLDLLCKYWSCTFNQCLDRICSMMIDGDSKEEITLKSKQIKTLTRKEASSQTKIEVKVRPWRDYDIEYWKSYGIELQWLKYAEIYPVAFKIVTKEGKKYIFPAEKYCYVYVEKKEGNLSLKLYSPFNTKGHKWCSKMDASVISLWTKVPEYGDRIIIASSTKDALCLSCQLHIPAIAPQGEGYDMSDTAIAELKRRYKKVFISFDTDKAGLADGKKLAKRTGFLNVVPDLGKCKDFSDYFKSLEDKQQFKQLELLFH